MGKNQNQAKNVMKPDPAAKAPATEKKDAETIIDKDTEGKNTPADSDRGAGDGTNDAKGDGDKALDSNIEPEKKTDDVKSAPKATADKKAGKGDKVAENANRVRDPNDGPADEQEEEAELSPEELFDAVIDGVISFSQPMAGALQNKPKVAKSWDSLVRKAKKLKALAETQKAKSVK